MSRRFDFIENEEMKKAWLHQEYKIREVLGKLRRGEINVLIATNVVEEGVDVQACKLTAMYSKYATI